MKPSFSDKLHSNNKIVLTEGEKIISNDVEVAETMNEFFVTVTDSLGIDEIPITKIHQKESRTLLKKLSKNF